MSTTLRFSMENYLAIPLEARELLEGRFLSRSFAAPEYVFELSDKTADEVLALVSESLVMVGSRPPFVEMRKNDPA